MYDHTFYKQVLISRSDIRPHIKWAVSLVILHMITSMFLGALCGYIWVNILTFSPRGEMKGGLMLERILEGWVPCTRKKLWKRGLMNEGILEGRVSCMMKTLWKIGQMHKGITERG